MTDQLDPATTRKALFDLILSVSFGRRDIILASGKPSNYYVDMKPTMLDPKGASLIAQLVVDRISTLAPDFIGGLEMGAVPITGAIIAHSFERGTPVRGMFVRKAPKDHGTKKLIEGLREGETLIGKRVVIIEDTTTTGGSAMKAAELCREMGAEVVLFMSVVDRDDGATELFAEKGIPTVALFKAAEFLAVG